MVGLNEEININTVMIEITEPIVNSILKGLRHFCNCNPSTLLLYENNYIPFVCSKIMICMTPI